jgi:hypothetical protein
VAGFAALFYTQKFPRRGQPSRFWKPVSHGIRQNGSGSEKLSLRVAGVVDIDADWQQALAPALTAAGQDCAAVLRLHPCAESELAFACAFRCLVCAFHGKSSNLSVEKEAQH